MAAAVEGYEAEQSVTALGSICLKIRLAVADGTGFDLCLLGLIFEVFSVAFLKFHIESFAECRILIYFFIKFWKGSPRRGFSPCLCRRDEWAGYIIKRCRLT